MTTTPEPSKTLVQRAPEVAGNVLRTILEFAIDGRGSIPGAKAAAARTLQSRGEHEAAVDSLVMQHVGLAGAQGFLTNLGGLLTLPVALPANLAGLAVVQMRMIAAIVHLRGYDVDDRRVRVALTMAMLGANFTDSTAMVVVFLSIAFFGNGLASITWSLVSALAPKRCSRDPG